MNVSVMVGSGCDDLFHPCQAAILLKVYESRDVSICRAAKITSIVYFIAERSVTML